MDFIESRIFVKKVFMNYELLQNILSNLAFKDLVHGQRVCQSWRMLIARSESLQRNLFLAPKHVYQLQGDEHPAWQDSTIETHSIFLPCYTTPTNSLKVFNVERVLSWKEGQWSHMHIMQPPATGAGVDGNVGGDGVGVNLGTFRGRSLPMYTHLSRTRTLLRLVR